MPDHFHLPKTLDDLNIPHGIRQWFYLFLNKLNIMDENKIPTEIANNIGLLVTKSIVKPYYSWKVLFIYDKLKEHGFEQEDRFPRHMSEYSESYFSKRKFKTRKHMLKPLTTNEIDTILSNYIDSEENPTENTLKQNIARLEPSYAIHGWDTGSIQKVYEYYLNNKKNTNIDDLIHYMNNTH